MQIQELFLGIFFKVDNNINSLNKIQNLFISYWKLLRILANSKEDNLLDEEKNLFCYYLTKLQFKNLNLSCQNLTKCNLNNSFLVQAKLQGADLQWAKLPLLDLIKAILGKAHLPISLIIKRILVPIIVILCFISLLFYFLIF